MPVIDFHAHAFPDKIAETAVASLEAAGNLSAHSDGSVGGLIAQMDRCGVDISVVQPVVTRPEQVASVNDWAMALSGPRIVPFGAMHPDLPNPAEEIARMASAGILGFKLHPEHQAFEPHEPRMDAIYAAAVEHEMIVFFHAGDDEIHNTCHGTPASFAAVLDAWPDLTVVLAHLGGYRQWEGVAELLVGRDVWLDTAYTLGHLPDADIVDLVRRHGTDRVLFGTDGPWTDPLREMEHLRRLDFDERELEAIFGGNAARLLSL